MKYSLSPIGQDTLDNGLAKVDYHITDKHTISGEYFLGDFNSLGPTNNAAAQPYWDTFSHYKAMVMGLHWVWVPTSTIVNELRGGFNRDQQITYPGDCNNIGQPVAIYNDLANFNGNSVPTGDGLPANCGFPTITITGFSALGTANSIPQVQGPDHTIQIIDNLSYIHGRHAFKFGEETRRANYTGATYKGTRGIFSFNATGTGATAQTALQNFLTGNLTGTTPSELVGDPARDVSEWGVAAFAQDDWRILDRLTLNLGLRYETITPMADQFNQLAAFDPNSATGLVQIGNGIGSLWRRPNDFSPRFGFAWDVTGKAKWVVRGGFSLIYVTEGFNVFVSQQGGIIPVGVNTIPTGALLNGVKGPGDITAGTVQFLPSQINWSVAGPVLPGGAIRCDSPLNAAPNNKPCAITTVNPNFHRPYAPAWNLSVQHAFSNNLSMQVAYVGSHGTGLVGLDDINAPPPGSGWETLSGSTCLPALGTAVNATCENINRPYFSEFPYLSNIISISNQDFSNYDGLQVTVTQRPWHGVSYLLGYTWSHSLDESGGDWNGASLPTNPFNVRSDYGNSQDDFRHRMTLSLTYALPEKRGFGTMLEGWRLNTVANVQTALPWYVSDTSDDISGVGDLTDKWNFYGNPSDFDGRGPNQVPFFKGTAPAAACSTEAAALDTGRTPVIPGATYTAALAKYGCYDQNGSMLLPPAFGTYGTMARGLFRGIGLKLVDFSVTKDTRFSDRFNGQFRFEVFNILNMTQYSPSVTGRTNKHDELWVFYRHARCGSVGSYHRKRRAPVG